MNKLIGLGLGLCLLSAAAGRLAAQENSDGTMPPPKVLFISREFVKPGKSGSMHEKAESAFVQAMQKAKSPTHYLAISSITGHPRVLFLTGYESFEAMEKDYQSMQKNAALAATLDHAYAADGELLSDADSTVAVYREDQSLRANVAIASMRYFEVSLYRIKPGHRHEWDEAVKLVKGAYEKIPTSHWAMYEVAYGLEGTTYLIFSALKSLSEVDQEFTQDKDFMAAMGEDGMKKLGELESSSIEFHQNNLFEFTPKMSYASDDWIKADPDYWKPKMSMAPMKKPADKAAEKPANP
jgi:hypothetical protein